MKVVNIHTRKLNQPKAKVAELFSTLATENDLVWPGEKWPPIRFKNGLKPGERGGHGPIKYTVEKYIACELIQFKFNGPEGFTGVHRFELQEIETDKTELMHTIEMETSGMGTIKWIFAIRWLHDALIEDAFDKVENHFSSVAKISEWNSWVKILRRVLGSKNKKKTT